MNKVALYSFRVIQLSFLSNGCIHDHRARNIVDWSSPIKGEANEWSFSITFGKEKLCSNCMCIAHDCLLRPLQRLEIDDWTGSSAFAVEMVIFYWFLLRNEGGIREGGKHWLDGGWSFSFIEWCLWSRDTYEEDDPTKWEMMLTTNAIRPSTKSQLSQWAFVVRIKPLRTELANFGHLSWRTAVYEMVQ